MKQSNPEYPNIAPVPPPPVKSEVDRLRELIVKERQTSGDALLALNAKQDKLVTLQGESDRLRVKAIAGAQSSLDAMRLAATNHILRTELDTQDANNHAYKRFNWLLALVCAGLVFHIVAGV